MNSLAKERIPFLFIADYAAKNIEVIALKDLHDADVEFVIQKNFTPKSHTHSFAFTPVNFSSYEKKFNAVIEKIKAGETYILNLTQATKIQSTLSLQEIYSYANADYKLRYKDKFVCFSPETFVRISKNCIDTFPMKGTINAAIVNAREKILEDKKELAEHIMVVDLLRNDLSMVATDVKVQQFRYVDTIKAGKNNLLQISSHISGVLESNWHERVGDIFKTLLPAGSITGAPKKSTVEIIESVEGYDRGFFSGVFGVYDGENLDSGVMIRFVEKVQDGYIYKSGGGITLDSDLSLEYQEYQDKIYLP